MNLAYALKIKFLTLKTKTIHKNIEFLKGPWGKNIFVNAAIELRVKLGCS